MPQHKDNLPAALASVQPFTLEELLVAAVQRDPDVAEVEVVDEESGNKRVVNVARVLNFAVVDIATADYAMRLLVDLTEEVDVNRRLAKAWVVEIERWLHTMTGPQVAAKVLLERKLERWAYDQRALDDNAKTFPLPAGRIETRKLTEPKVAIDDEDALIKWLTVHATRDQYSAVVKTVESVLVSKLREYCTIVKTSTDDADQTMSVLWGDPTEGVVVEGVRVEIPDITVTVKPGG